MSRSDSRGIGGSVPCTHVIFWSDVSGPHGFHGDHNKAIPANQAPSTQERIWPLLGVSQEPLVCQSLLGPISQSPQVQTSQQEVGLTRHKFSHQTCTLLSSIHCKPALLIQTVIINIKQYRAHQVASLLTVGHLCHEVRKINHSPHTGRWYFTHCNSLANSVIANGQVLLFQCWLGPLSVMNDRHVVAIDIPWSSRACIECPAALPYHSPWQQTLHQKQMIQSLAVSVRAK